MLAVGLVRSSAITAVVSVSFICPIGGLCCSLSSQSLMRSSEFWALCGSRSTCELAL